MTWKNRYESLKKESEKDIIFSHFLEYLNYDWWQALVVDICHEDPELLGITNIHFKHEIIPHYSTMIKGASAVGSSIAMQAIEDLFTKNGGNSSEKLIAGLLSLTKSLGRGIPKEDLEDYILSRSGSASLIKEAAFTLAHVYPGSSQVWSGEEMVNNNALIAPCMLALYKHDPLLALKSLEATDEPDNLDFDEMVFPICKTLEKLIENGYYENELMHWLNQRPKHRQYLAKNYLVFDEFSSTRLAYLVKQKTSTSEEIEKVMYHSARLETGDDLAKVGDFADSDIRMEKQIALLDV